MKNKRVSELVELKNAREVIKKYESKTFNEEILDMKRIGGRYVEPSSINKYNEELMIDLFDEKPKKLIKKK